MYDTHPSITLHFPTPQVWEGWDTIINQLKRKITRKEFVVCVECYQSVSAEELLNHLIEGLLQIALENCNLRCDVATDALMNGH